MKTELTIEESTKLIGLGVDKKLASIKGFVSIHPEVLKGNAEYAKPWGWMPKFTLTDLLSILPKEIDSNILVINSTGFNKKTEKLEEGWSVFYVNYKYDVVFGEESIFSAPELIDALYQLLCWVIENSDANYVQLP